MRTRRLSFVADFLDVPEAELANCLRAFKGWLERQKTLAADAATQGTAFSRPEFFDWEPKAPPSTGPSFVSATSDVRDLGLRFAAVRACLEMRMLVLEDFSAIEAWELAKVPNVGPSSVVKIREMLHSVGLDFQEPSNPVRRARERSTAVRAGQGSLTISNGDHVAELGLRSVTLGRLLAKGVHTIGQLRAKSPRELGAIFGVAGGREVFAKLRERQLDLEPSPRQLELWRYGLLPLSALRKPSDEDPIEELAPWLGSIARSARRAGLESVGDLRRLVQHRQRRVRGIGEHGWRRLAEYFGSH